MDSASTLRSLSNFKNMRHHSLLTTMFLLWAFSSFATQTTQDRKLPFEKESEIAASNGGLSVQFMLDVPDCDSLCIGQVSCFVQGGVPPFTYSWSTGSIDSFTTGVCAQSQISLYVEDSVGDWVNTVYFVPQPLRFLVTTTPASCATCCDGSGLGTVSTSCSLPVTYLWNPGMVTLPTINNMCGNITYSLCVTDVCGCTLCDTLILCGFPAGTSNLIADRPVFQATYASAGQCIMASLLDGPSTAQLDLFDLQGRKILQSTLEKSETRSINAAALASGTYLVVVSDENRLLGNQLLVIP